MIKVQYDKKTKQVYDIVDGRLSELVKRDNCEIVELERDMPDDIAVVYKFNGKDIVKDSNLEKDYRKKAVEAELIEAKKAEILERQARQELISEGKLDAI